MAKKSFLTIAKEQGKATFSIRGSKAAKSIAKKRPSVNLRDNRFLRSMGEGFIDVFSGKSRDRTKKRLVRK
ncbi:hypothetical protein LCGC14_0422010 [marine sediment metagenome]|uniref:Uncharacterized protein n=1 Tax=marine sediment metagenome TaxID=412755 RepID=A0A0F9VCL1_9ZZZZ